VVVCSFDSLQKGNLERLKKILESSFRRTSSCFYQKSLSLSLFSPHSHRSRSSSDGPMGSSEHGRCALRAVAGRARKKHELTTLTTTTKIEAPSPLHRQPIENSDDDDDRPLPTPPPSPSPPHGCCFGDESPRPGELEAIRSSSVKKKKSKVKKAKREQPLPPSSDLRPLALPAPPPPTPPTPLQTKTTKDKGRTGGRKNRPAPSTAVPFDARPSLAAERERHRFDPRLPAPGWRAPPSPLSLLEEALDRDPWRLLVACCLLNRTTAGVARPCLRAFFSGYPDAAAASAIQLEGEEGGGGGGGGSAELEALAALFRPCGCHRKRAAAVVRLSREFLSPTWTDPRELFGVGEYAADAYWIFVRGIWHCGAGGEEEEEQEEERRERSEGNGGSGGGGSGGEKAAKKASSLSSSSSPSRSSSFSWRPRDKDLAKYVDYLVETGGQGCGLEREEF